MIQLTDKNFEENLRRPILVMFKASFAGPSLLAEPVFEKVSKKLEREVAIGVFDLEGNPNIPVKFGIKQIPMFCLFVDGKIFDAVAGAVPEERIVGLLDDF